MIFLIPWRSRARTTTTRSWFPLAFAEKIQRRVLQNCVETQKVYQKLRSPFFSECRFFGYTSNLVNLKLLQQPSKVRAQRVFTRSVVGFDTRMYARFDVLHFRGGVNANRTPGLVTTFLLINGNRRLIRNAVCTPVANTNN